MNLWIKFIAGRREGIVSVVLIASVAGYACYRFLSQDELPTLGSDRNAITTQVQKDHLRSDLMMPPKHEAEEGNFQPIPGANEAEQESGGFKRLAQSARLAMGQGLCEASGSIAKPN